MHDFARAAPVKIPVLYLKTSVRALMAKLRDRSQNAPNSNFECNALIPTVRNSRAAKDARREWPR